MLLWREGGFPMLKTGFISLIALTAATPAFAQSNPDESTTDANGDTIVVTASRSGEGVRIDQLGASVTVIDAARRLVSGCTR